VSAQQCSGCGRHFSGLTTFDRHRTGTYEPDRRACVHPEAAGLSPVVRSTSKRTVWGNPGTPDSLKAVRATQKEPL